MMNLQIRKICGSTFNDILSRGIIEGDNRYSDYTEEKIAINLLKNKVIQIKPLIIPTVSGLNEELHNKVRGYFCYNPINYFIKKGFKLIGYELSHIDVIMKKGKTELWFEFGQTGINKLWQYLSTVKSFIKVYDENILFVIKRGKNFKKGMKEMHNNNIKLVKRLNGDIL